MMSVKTPLTELLEAYRALSAAIEGLHSTIFGVASGKDPKAALSALEDGGVIHEQAHVLLRVLWPKKALKGLVKERSRLYQLEYSKRPEVKERKREYIQRPEVKERRRLWFQTYSKKPEAREKRRAFERAHSKTSVFKKRRQAWARRPETIARRKLQLTARDLYPGDKAAQTAFVEEGMKDSFGATIQLDT